MISREGTFWSQKKRVFSRYELPIYGVCEGGTGPCDEETQQVFFTLAQTAYQWDGTGENPNRELILFSECQEEYREHWAEMWKGYHL